MSQEISSRFAGPQPVEVVEGEDIEVRVRLDRVLDASDDKACDPALTPPQDEACELDGDNKPIYPDGRPICHRQRETDDDERLCIEGGITVRDSYNDSSQRDAADELISYVFPHQRKTEDETETVDKAEQILQYFACNDGRAANDRRAIAS